MRWEMRLFQVLHVTQRLLNAIQVYAKVYRRSQTSAKFTVKTCDATRKSNVDVFLARIARELGSISSASQIIWKRKF